jgi:hypothetical protein
VIVGICFDGDDNGTLKWIQHDTYDRHLGLLYGRARERYMQAARFVGVQTELGERVARLDTFDHRVLQAAHDESAAYYRFTYDAGGQMPLPLDGTPPYAEWLEQRWRAFYEVEAESLAVDAAIARSVLTAVAYQNRNWGYAAEKELLDLLKLRYGPLMRRTEEEEKRI